MRDKKVVLEEFPIRNVGVDAGLRLQYPARQVQGPARAPRLQLRLRFRGDEPARFSSASTSASPAISRAPNSPRPEFRKARSWKSCKPCATRCRRSCSPSPTPIRSAAVQQAVRDNLREALALFREAGYEIKQHQAGQRQDRRALQRRVPGRGPGHRAFRAVLQALAAAPRHDGERARGRQRAIREPAAAMGFRHHRRVLGRVAVARQRAARLLELAGRRPARLAQPDRHQESGGRCADRARDLRQGPRRAGRRHQGARPRAVVEFLRRAAMDLRQAAHRALGPLRPSGRTCRNTGSPAFPTIWWWDADKAAKVPQRS